MTSSLILKRMLLVSSVSLPCLMAANAMADSPGQEALKSRSIAYAIYYNQWAIYQSAGGKEECPQGVGKVGARELFKAMYPEDPSKYTYKDTRLVLQGDEWNPTPGPDPIPYVEATGKTSFGLNLDGKVGPKDFTSPDGVPGVDNQFFRVFGCAENYRGPDGVIYTVGQNFYRNHTFNRVVLELTNVDDLTNDPDVDVTITRGIDDLLTDGQGTNVLPGGTQRIDMRWTKKFNQHLKGKIVDGILTTEPADTLRILESKNRKPIEVLFRGGRLQLKLTDGYAEGLVAGYVDINRYYFNYYRQFRVVETSFGHETGLSQYRKMMQLADGFPDAKNGANTAISGAMNVKFVQTFVLRPEVGIAEKDAPGAGKSSAVSKTGER